MYRVLLEPKGERAFQVSETADAQTANLDAVAACHAAKVRRLEGKVLIVNDKGEALAWFAIGEDC